MRQLLPLLFAASLLASDFPDPATDPTPKTPKQTIVLAGGCFWCVEAVFQQIEGVEKVVSGYSGGDAASAHYNLVSSGRTGHAEAVQVTYDARKVSYGQILKVFFDIAHDPTQLNRQGPDTGPQYRSAIFYADPDQKRTATLYIDQLNRVKVFRAPIVTQVVELTKFYPAEEHHQNYCNRNKRDPYVQGVAMPKVNKVRTELPGLVKKQ